jgi:adenosylcobinamide-GDP ribazoletransferase
MHRLLAALSFFTRFPFWKIAKLNKQHYERVVPLWPLTGWLTAASMMLVFGLSALFLPVNIALVIAILTRLAITGALHEDGFADFFDGFGGGKDRNSILRIMKDSHIGTYGVVALIIYFLLLFLTLQTYFNAMFFNQPTGCFVIQERNCWTKFIYAAIFFAADPFAKWASSNIINILPYARNEEDAKNHLIYNKMTIAEKLFGLAVGCLPAFFFFNLIILIPMAVSAATAAVIIFICYKKLNAYTGDCCGACFIISELAFYLTALAVLT